MSLSVNWPTGVITVPKADTVLVGTDPISGRQIRSYNSDTFRRELRDLEDDEAGRVFDRTHDYNPAVTLGGVVYAPQLIVNSAYYTVEFEDGTYRVSLQGTNNNIADVSVINSVSIQPNNSAGNTVPVTADDVWAAKKVDNNDADSMGNSVQNTERGVRSLL